MSPFNPEALKLKAEEYDMKVSEPGFWDDPDKSNLKMKELKDLQGAVETMDGLERTYEDLFTLIEMAGDDESMAEEVGEDNMFIFGMSSDEVINYENNGGYNPMDIFNSDQDVRDVLMQLINGFYSKDDPELFRDIYNSLLNTQSTSKADTYFILKDFRSYAEAQERVEECYRKEKEWAHKAILNIAASGKFSSDRTIREYVDELWHLDKIDLRKANTHSRKAK